MNKAIVGKPDSIQKIATTAYWSSSLTLFAFFNTWSFCFSLFPLWLSQTLQLNGKDIGTIFGANALAALIIMPFYGVIQDRLGTQKQLLVLVGGLLVITGPFFELVYRPLLDRYFIVGVVVGAVYFALTFGAAVGTLEALIERIVRQHAVEFGKARLWGSLGWACASFVAGNLFNVNPELNFWLASLTGIGFLICLIWLPSPLIQVGPTISTKVTFTELIGVFSLPAFWRLSLYVMGVSCIYQIYEQQFPIYFASFFADIAQGNRFYGYLNSFQVFLEAGLMFLAPAIVNRIGAKNGLLLSGLVMVVRMAMSGLADGPILISLLKLLHALELPILLVAIFKYIVLHFDARLSATIYLVGFNVFMQVVTTALSSQVGELYDTFGFAEAYLLLAGVVATNLLISMWLLDEKPCLERLKSVSRSAD